MSDILMQTVGSTSNCFRISEIRSYTPDVVKSKSILARPHSESVGKESGYYSNPESCYAPVHSRESSVQVSSDHCSEQRKIKRVHSRTRSTGHALLPVCNEMSSSMSADYKMFLRPPLSTGNSPNNSNSFSKRKDSEPLDMHINGCDLRIQVCINNSIASQSEHYQKATPTHIKITNCEPNSKTSDELPTLIDLPLFSDLILNSDRPYSSNEGNVGGFSALDEENLHFTLSEAVIASVEQLWCDSQLISSTQEERNGQMMTDEDEVLQNAKLWLSAYRNYPHMEFQGQKSLIPLLPSSSKQINNSSNTMQTSLLESNNLINLNSVEVPNMQAKADHNPSVNVSSLALISPSSSADELKQAILRKAAEFDILKSLDWMVPVDDTPQNLLPLPKRLLCEIAAMNPHYSIITPNMQLNSNSTRLRGNYQWAPPRPQILFRLQSVPGDLEKAMLHQSYLCAGCGMYIDRNFFKNMCFCFYYYKYFCQTCLSGKLSQIPTFILNNWDFKKYPVSNIAAELLNRIYDYPLFNIMLINQDLYKKFKILSKTYIKRIQLSYVFSYVRACSSAHEFLSKFENRTHWATEVHVYSLCDFINLKEGTLLSAMDKLYTDCRSHVIRCLSCRGKGFICEYCRQQEPIFAFDIFAVSQCKSCHSCFHAKCYSVSTCPKCLRICQRKSAHATLIDLT